MKRQTRLILAAIIGSIALCAGLWFLVSSDPVLPKIATPVTSTADWYLSTYGDYYWLSANEVMFFRREGSRWTAYRRNIHNGAESALTGFSERFKASGGDANYVVDIAPDGQHIMWWTHADIGDNVCLCRTDGSGFQRFKDSLGSEIYWMADGKHVFQFVSSNLKNSRIIQIENMNRPESQRPITIRSDSPITQTGVDLGNLGRGNLLPLSETRILASNDSLTDSNHRVRLYDFGLGDRAAPAKMHAVNLPAHAECLNVLFSPRGDHIAWMLRIERVLPFAAVLQRVWPRYRADSQPVISLRISRADGSDMHEIGYFPKETPKPENSEWLSAYHLTWLPDNRHVSFLDNDRLYILPAR